MSELVQENIDLQPEETASTLPLPGAFLKAAREAHGFSLDEVSQALKFSVRQIEALEHDDYAQLKGNTFIRGFVRSYARYLKLDESSLLAGLSSVVPATATEVRPVESMEAEMPEVGGDSNKRAYWLSFGVLLLGGLAWFAWQGRPMPEQAETASTLSVPATVPSAAAPAPVQIPADPGAAANPSEGAAAPAETPAGQGGEAATSPAAAAAAPAATSANNTATTTAAATTATTAAPNPNERQLVFDFSEVAWVEVRDAGDHVLYSGNSTPNTQQVVRGRPPLQLVIGNARSVKLRYEGRLIDLQPYTRVDVARLTLDDNTK